MALGTPDFSSVYGSMGSPGPFDAGGFGTAANLKISGGAGGLGTKAAGGGMAFPFLAAATLGSSVIGGIFGGRQAARDREFAAQMGKMQAEAAMQGAFRQAQQNQWMSTVMPEYQYQVQKRAREYENLFFEPQERFLRSEERLQAFQDELSPEARELSARQRAGRLAETAADRRALTDAMFGAPVYNPSRYTNAAWMQG